MLNNKTLWTCCACFITFVVTNAQDPNKSEVDKVRDYFYYKCFNNTKSERFFTSLDQDVTDFQKYFSYTIDFIPERKNNFCNELGVELGRKMGVVSRSLKPCLSREEEFLSEFLRKSWLEFTHFLCHNKGENMDSLFSPQRKGCREALNADISNDIGNCFSKIFKPLSGHLTKKELCDDMGVAEKCFALVLDEKCPSDPNFKHLNYKFFEYITTPCSGCVAYQSLLLLSLSVLIYFLFSH